MPYSEVEFSSDRVKLRKGENERAVLSWNAQGASSVTLSAPSLSLSVNSEGNYVVSPEQTTTYKLVATYPDGSTQTKHMQIEIHPAAYLSYDVVEHIDGDNVSAELMWSIENAQNVQIDGVLVPSKGFKSYLINHQVYAQIQYDDPFGSHSKTICICQENKSFWVLLKVVKLLLRPFTFIGFVGKKEMRWTIRLCFIGIASTLGIFIANNSSMIEQNEWLQLFNGHDFFRARNILSVFLYIWMMQLGKRWKDTNISQWCVLLFVPLIVFLWIPIGILVSTFDTDYVLLYALWTEYLGLFWLTSLIVACMNSKHKQKYQKIKVW